MESSGAFSFHSRLSAMIGHEIPIQILVVNDSDGKMTSYVLENLVKHVYTRVVVVTPTLKNDDSLLNAVQTCNHFRNLVMYDMNVCSYFEHNISFYDVIIFCKLDGVDDFVQSCDVLNPNSILWIFQGDVDASVLGTLEEFVENNGQYDTLYQACHDKNTPFELVIHKKGGYEEDLG